MKELKNKKYLKLIKENNANMAMGIVRNDEDALKVLDVVMEVLNEEISNKEAISERDIECFIEERLCLFSNKRDVLEWVYDEEYQLDVMDFLKGKLITIDETMLGKDLEDVLLDRILESDERYYEISNDVYLTYYN